MGARRSYPVSLETAWNYIVSVDGIRCWLGGDSDVYLEPGSEYKLARGIQGKLRVFKPFSHLRITWKPPKWKKPSLIQVRVIPGGDKTTIAFHKEGLPDAEARNIRKIFSINCWLTLKTYLRAATPINSERRGKCEAKLFW